MGQKKLRLLACFSLVVVLLASCGGRKETGTAKNTADGLVLDAYKQKDYPLLLSLADSLGKTGDLSGIASYYWLGYGSESHFLTMESNAPIGLWEGLKYTGEAIDDIRGQQLFVYSDGFTLLCLHVK